MKKIRGSLIITSFMLGASILSPFPKLNPLVNRAWAESGENITYKTQLEKIIREVPYSHIFVGENIKYKIRVECNDSSSLIYVNNKLVGRNSNLNVCGDYGAKTFVYSMRGKNILPIGIVSHMVPKGLLAIYNDIEVIGSMIKIKDEDGNVFPKREEGVYYYKYVGDIKTSLIGSSRGVVEASKKDRSLAVKLCQKYVIDQQ